MKSNLINVKRDITLFHSKINLNENISLFKMLSEVYPAHVVAKSTTEPENSNDLYMANSTPKACFFIRSTRTPKENTAPRNRASEFLSMVACNGKGFALCCVPCIAVSQPVTRYRPNPEKFSGSLHKSYMELSKMFYTFLFIHSRLRISVFANSLTEAYSRLPKSDIKPLLIARKSSQANQTACQTPEQNNRLPKASRYGYDDCTTKTVTGYRTCKICDFFVSQISQNHGITTPVIYSEFAVRLISRDKPSNRTNKASRVTAVVETVSHPLAIYPFNHLLNTVTNMKNPTQTPSGNTARNVSIALSFATKGGVYA
ncbi:ash family protein [Actinobacillus indolicus]|uniref:ash family protein n=1 Tax=Actinobacillus indolicus TaxID=51049 RepID=UPI001FCA24DD|nr:ash family protein [Actinobacillus indolicus]